MEQWEFLLTALVAAVIGAIVTRMANAPDKLAQEDKVIVGRLSKLESEVAVLRETKLTEPQVRGIVHEQLQPLMVAVNSLKDQHDLMVKDIQAINTNLALIAQKLHVGEE